jgi:hypothetical protein
LRRCGTKTNHRSHSRRRTISGFNWPYSLALYLGQWLARLPIYVCCSCVLAQDSIDHVPVTAGARVAWYVDDGNAP